MTVHVRRSSSRSGVRAISVARIALGAALSFGSSCLPPPALAGDAQYVPPGTLLDQARGVPDRTATERLSPADAAKAALMPWTFLGPAPIEGARNPNDAESFTASGRVVSIAVDPRNGDVAYAAAAQGGVWKTVDGGVTWLPLTDGLSSLVSGAVTLDPQNPRVVYYGTGEQHFCADCLYGDGLFRSTDEGGSWSKIAAKTDVGTYISRVAVRPDDSLTVLVASDRGVVRSTDGGATWTAALTASWGTDLAVDPSAPSTAYAAILNSGIYKSTDGGGTWARLAGGLPTSSFSRVNIALAPSRPSTLYASFVAGGTGLLFGMYRTTDGGATWTQLSATPDYLDSSISGATGQGWFDNCLVVDPSDPDVCFAGGAYPDPAANAIVKTSDGGATWTGIAAGVDGRAMHQDHHVLAFGPDGRLWNGNDGGVWTSDDGGAHWTDRNATLAVTQFYTIAHDATDASILVGGTQDNGTIALQAGAWTQRITKDGGPCLVDAATPLAFFGTTQSLGSLLYVTADTTIDLTGDWVLGDRASFAKAPLVRSPDDPSLLYLGTFRVWRSTDTGVSWVPDSPGLTRTTWAALLSIGFGVGPPHARYATTEDGWVWLATDDAPAWTKRAAGLPGVPLSAIAVDPNDWHTAFLTANVTTGDRVFRTDNDGASWTSVTSDLIDGVRPIAMVTNFSTDPPTIHLGTDYGVYTSFDAGAHWVKTSQGLPSLAVYALSLDLAHDRLVAGTHGRGAWSSPLPVATDVRRDRPPAGESQLTASVAAGLARGGRIEVRYRLSEGAETSLELFTPAGRRVAGARLGWQEPGSHEHAWDGAAPATGLYLLRLTAGSTRTTARVVVFR